MTDPTHWAVLLMERDVWIDTETGELVDEELIDWNTKDDPEAAPAEGLRHVNTVEEASRFIPDYYCLDYQAAGLALSERFARFSGTASINTESAEAVDLDGEDEDAKAAREAAAAQAQIDAERRERRKVIALNKLGQASCAVRRQFLSTLVSRKTLPKGAGIFMADALARDAHLLTEQHGSAVSGEILGVKADGGYDGAAIRKLVTDLPDNGDGRAQVIILAVVLGALEARTPKDAWRHPAPVRDLSASQWGWDRRLTSGDLLRFLAANGYDLSPIEQVVTGERAADEVYDEHLADASCESTEADDEDVAEAGAA